MYGKEKPDLRILWLLVACGTIFRFVYGYMSKAWLEAPDQLAWGLGIDDMFTHGPWQYTRLVHAPHEGGGLVSGLLAVMFRPLAFVMPPLSFAALLLDAISRYLQIRVAWYLCGRKNAVWYGCWTVVAVPVLHPWATVNFGLHALFAFLPFLFCGCMAAFRQHKYLPMIMGIFCGVSVSLTYDSIIFLPVFLLLAAMQYGGQWLRKAVPFFFWLFVSLLPHLVTRLFFSPGTSLLSIREQTWDTWWQAFHMVHAATVWITALPGSFMLSVPPLPPLLSCVLVAGFLVAGCIFFSKAASIHRSTRAAACLLAVVFLITYAASPFYGRQYQNRSYVYYRHLCFIIPLIVWIMVSGMAEAGIPGRVFFFVWMLFCLFSVTAYISTSRPPLQAAYRPAGWIMAQKYTDAATLTRISSSVAPAQQPELFTGYGWGLAAKWLKDHPSPSDAAALVQEVNMFPADRQPQLLKGIRYAFAKGITPVLDTAWLVRVENAIRQQPINHDR
jgi:uncharacterized membrane protein YozB (DUF420 family)